MGKERLEEIKRLDVSLLKGTKFYEHWLWLIEQAERVQELEEDKKAMGDLIEKTAKTAWNVEQQNKRYREALEYIAAGIPVHSPIDYENKARKALESESE